MIDRLGAALTSPDIEYIGGIVYSIDDVPNGVLLRTEQLGFEHLSFEADGIVGAPPPWLKSELPDDFPYTAILD